MANNRYRGQKVNGHWLKNAMKGVGVSADQVISEIAPNLTSTTRGIRNIGNDVIKSVRTNRNINSRISDQLANNKYLKNASLAYKNAIDDLKSGKINNKEREIEAIMGDSEDGISFGDIDNMDQYDSSGDISVNIDQSGIQQSMMKVVEQSAKNTIGQVKMQKATMDTILSTSAHMLQQHATIGAELGNRLDAINENLSALLEFQNKNMTKFIEASMAYYEYVGRKESPIKGNIDGNKTHGSEIFSSSGEINYGQYKSYVKQQIRNIRDNSTAGMISSMIDDDMLKMAASNPIGFLTTGLTRYMMPKVLTTSIQSMESAFTNYMPTLLSKLGDMASDESSGIMGQLKRYVGEIFGVKQQKKGKFNRIEVDRGPVPFDGETKHAITEIMTKELREQTGYLRVIANHYDSNADQKMRDNGEYWSYKQNKYVKRNEIDKDITEQLTDSIRDAFSNTAFGSIMMNASTEIVRGDSNNKRVQRDRQEFDNTVTELFTLIERSDKTVGLDQLLTLVQKTGASSNTKRLLKRYIQNKFLTDTAGMKSVNLARMKANKAVNDAKSEIENNPGYYNLLNSSYYGTDEDIDVIMDRINGWGVNNDGRANTRRQKYKRVTPQRDEQPIQEPRNRIDILRDRVESTIQSRSASEWVDRGKDILRRKIGYKMDQYKAIFSGDARGAMASMFAEFSDRFMRITKTAKHFLFGDKDEEGKYKSGVFSDVINNIKGAFKSTANNLKDGVMKSVFGKVKNSETGQYERSNEPNLFDSVKDSLISGAGVFKRFLFGDIENGQKGLLRGVRDAWNANFTGRNASGNRREDSDLKLPSSKLLGGTMTGGVLGALLGGPIIGAMAGLAISIKSDGDTFKEMLFGKENGLDIGDGRKVKKEGLLGRLGNAITANILNPMKTELKYIKDSTMNVVEHKILAPFSFAAEFATEKIAKLSSSITDTFKNGFNTVFGAIKEDILTPITSTIGNVMTKTSDLIFKTVKTVVSTPGNIIIAAIKAMKLKEKFDNLLPVRAVKLFLKETRRLIFAGIKGLFKGTFKLIKGVIKTPFKMLGLLGKGAAKLKNKAMNSRIGRRIRDKISGSEFARQLKARTMATGEYGSLLDRIRLNSIDYKNRAKEIKEQKTVNKVHDKNAKIIARASRNQFKEDTEEARQWLKYNNPNAWKLLEGDSITTREQGRSTRGMSVEEINRANLSDLSPEGQQVKLLQSIWGGLQRFFNKKDSENRENTDVSDINNEENGINDSITNSPSGGSFSVTNNASETKRRISKKFITVSTLKGDYRISKASSKIYLNGEAVSYEDAPLRVQLVAKANNKKNQMKKSAGDSWKNFKNNMRERFRFDRDDDTEAMVRDAENVTGENIERHSLGGILKMGLSLVGEKGAELVHKGKNGVVSVLSNAKTRIAARRAKQGDGTILSNFKSSPSYKKDEEQPTSNARNDELTRERKASQEQAVANATTAEKKQAEMKAKREEEREKEELAAEKRTAAATEGAHKSLSDLLDPKKLFLGSLLLFGKQIGGFLTKAAPIIEAVGSGVKSVVSTIGDISSGLGKIMDKLGIPSFLANTGMKIADAIENRKDNKKNDRITNRDENTADSTTVSGLKKYAGNLVSHANEVKAAGGIGKYTHKKAIQTAERNELKYMRKLSNQAAKKAPKTKIGKVANKLKSVAQKGASMVRRGVMLSGIEKSPTTASTNVRTEVSNVFTKAGTAVKESMGKLVANGKTKIAKLAENSTLKGSVASIKGAASKLKITGAIKNTKMATVGKDILKSSTKLSSSDSKAVTKICETVSSWANTIKGFIEKLTGKTLKSSSTEAASVSRLTKLLEKLPKNKLTAMIEKISAKSAARSTVDAGAAVTTGGLSKAVEVILFSADGAEGAAKLFQIPKDDVDGTMISIATAFGATNASLAAAIVAIVCEAIASAIGFDILTDLATSFYGAIRGYDSSEYQSLNSAQTELKNKYEEYRDNLLKGEYTELKKRGELPDGMNYEDYKKTVIEETSKGNSGNKKYQANYKSLNEFNDKKNATTLDRTISGAVNFASNTKEGFKALYYKATGNTSGLNSIYKKLAKEDKEETAFRNTKVNNTWHDKLDRASDRAWTKIGQVGDKVLSFFGRGESNGNDYMNGKPYFSQTDNRWASMKYGSGDSMGKAGCGPTALAMAVNDIKQKDAIDPTDMAKLSTMTGNVDDVRGTNSNFISQSSALLGINTDEFRRPNANTLRSQLGSGTSTILLGHDKNGSGPYTSAGHYVVATGMPDENHVTVSDPRGRGYSKTYEINDLADKTDSSWSLYGRGLLNSIKSSFKTTANNLKEEALKKVGTSSVNAISSAAVIKEALSHKGYTEESGNRQKFGIEMAKVFGHPKAAAWCATFVTYCFYKACGSSKNLTNNVLHGATTASCASNVSKFKSAGKWAGRDAVPKPGYVIFYTFSHTGIVEKADNSNVYTIEGNTSGSNGYDRNSGMVWTKKRQRGSSSILGYGIPNVDGAEYTGSTTDNTTNEANANSGTTTTTDNNAASVLDQLTNYVSNFSTEFASRMLTGNTKNTDYSTVLNNIINPQTSESTGTDANNSSGSSQTYSGTGAIGTTMDENAKFIYNALHKYGVPNINIAAALGNFQAESSIDPTVIEGIYDEKFTVDGPRHKDAMADLSKYTSSKVFASYSKRNSKGGKKVSYNPNAYKGPDGKYYPGLGIVQWTGDGAYNLIKNAPGGKWWSGEYQAELIVDKKPPTGKDHFGGPLKNWKNPESNDIAVAARNFSKYYEGNTKNGQNERVKYARQWYDKISSWGKGEGTTHRVFENSTQPTQVIQPKMSMGSTNDAKITVQHTQQSNTFIDKLLESIITILTDISSNTRDSSSKLEYLKSIKATTQKNTNTVILPDKKSKTISTLTETPPTSDDIAAVQIARGRY